ncbi:glutathione S-transferase, partial [Klebsiella pneumoniae]
PERWAPAAAEQLVENCRQYRKNLYLWFEQQLADYPERWAPAAAEQLVENCRQYRKNLYLWFEQQLA